MMMMTNCSQWDEGKGLSWLQDVCCCATTTEAHWLDQKYRAAAKSNTASLLFPHHSTVRVDSCNRLFICIYTRGMRWRSYTHLARFTDFSDIARRKTLGIGAIDNYSNNTIFNLFCTILVPNRLSININDQINSDLDCVIDC